MDRVKALEDELGALETILPRVEARTDLLGLAVDFKERIAVLQEEIKAIENLHDADSEHTEA